MAIRNQTEKMIDAAAKLGVNVLSLQVSFFKLKTQRKLGLCLLLSVQEKSYHGWNLQKVQKMEDLQSSFKN
jgi:hypothetical protein